MNCSGNPNSEDLYKNRPSPILKDHIKEFRIFYRHALQLEKYNAYSHFIFSSSNTVKVSWCVISDFRAAENQSNDDVVLTTEDFN